MIFVASEELKAKVQTVAALISEEFSLDYAESLFKYGKYALEREKSAKYGLRVVKFAKEKIEEYVASKGGTVWQLQQYADKEGLSFAELDLYFDILLFEARNKVVDSYLLYIEKNRSPKDRFYLPRRSCLMKIGIPQSLQDMLDDKLDILSISLPPGTGKAQPLYSKVLTPNGFVEMGSIRVGDTVISGSGKPSRVLGVYPQGKKPIYELTFDDGSKCRCSDEHLWTVQTRDDRRGGKYRTVELKSMLHNLRVENGKRLNYSIDYVGKIDFRERDLPLHPYVLGVILGDGCIAGESLAVSLPDDELRIKFNELLPKGYETRHNGAYDYRIHGHEGAGSRTWSYVKESLRSMGLQGKRSHEKFIPKEYLYASWNQRFCLLMGLLDTDGFADKGNIEYTTSSPWLANDMRELVHSLGGYASVVEREAKYKNANGECVKCKNSFRMCIQFPSTTEKPFALSRKADRYNPKRNVIKRFIKSAEYIGEQECQCIYIDGPSHLYITDDYIITHNTSIEMFFHSALLGWFPKDFSLFYSHSGDITKMYYNGVLNILTSDEYCWHEIFPDCRIYATDAKREQIHMNRYQPFASLQTTSVGAKNAGKVRAGLFLLCDDIISGIEEALNINILDKLWNIYSVDARQRKTSDNSWPEGKPAKELHICTRWSVHDIVGRLQRLYEGSDRCRFIAVPDIDPVTGKSNFNYDVNGFTEEFFHDQELAMDEISYRCLYKNDPIEREGLLYTADELRYFVDLPLREPDAIMAVCDTKSKGTDFLVLPVLYQYDNDYYLVDCICTDSSDYGVQYGRMADMLVNHKVQQCEFESNAGGDRVAFEVEALVQEKGGRCNITTKPTETNKETRIIVNADWVKKNVLFKPKEEWGVKTDYYTFMNWLLAYSVAGKNKHDDVPDCMANFALFVQNKYRIKTAYVIKSPF